MRSRRGKRSETFFPSILMRKWLNIKPKVHEFSEDELDSESEDDDSRNNKVDDSSYATVGFEGTNQVAGPQAKANSSRLRRRKSETLRLQYISNKDVRIMIGTWNVAGRVPFEELELDDWLCTGELADMYILGFQEVVPLNAGNVLGAEDSKPILKWESIIRRTLNTNALQQKKQYNSYSAPPSPVSETPALNNLFADKVNSSSCSNKLDWPEHPLDIPQQPLTSCTKLRRVLSSNPGIGFDVYFRDLSLKSGLKRVYHSSGNLGMLWSEQQESSIVLESLKDVSDKSCEEDTPLSNVMDKYEVDVNGECPKSLSRPRFVRIVSKQMVGIYVSVWVCRQLRRHVNNLKVYPVGVGLMGYMGNKGSISVSMSIFQTRFCFVCSHLTSGHKKGDEEKRNSDVNDILQRTRFSSTIDGDKRETIPSHDHIFWFGDLNYRLNLPDTEVRELVSLEQWDKLMNYDQLTNELRRGHIFDGWEEGLVQFPPTYKYEINSDRYVGENVGEGQKRRACFSSIAAFFSVPFSAEGGRITMCMVVTPPVRSHIGLLHSPSVLLFSNIFPPLINFTSFIVLGAISFSLGHSARILSLRVATLVAAGYVFGPISDPSCNRNLISSCSCTPAISK